MQRRTRSDRMLTSMAKHRFLVAYRDNNGRLVGAECARCKKIAFHVDGRVPEDILAEEYRWILSSVISVIGRPVAICSQWRAEPSLGESGPITLEAAPPACSPSGSWFLTGFGGRLWRNTITCQFARREFSFFCIRLRHHATASLTTVVGSRTSSSNRER
jgi:hypothetical protein